MNTYRDLPLPVLQYIFLADEMPVPLTRAEVKSMLQAREIPTNGNKSRKEEKKG